MNTNTHPNWQQRIREAQAKRDAEREEAERTQEQARIERKLRDGRNLARVLDWLGIPYDLTPIKNSEDIDGITYRLVEYEDLGECHPFRLTLSTPAWIGAEWWDLPHVQGEVTEGGTVTDAELIALADAIDEVAALKSRIKFEPQPEANTAPLSEGALANLAERLEGDHPPQTDFVMALALLEIAHQLRELNKHLDGIGQIYASS